MSNKPKETTTTSTSSVKPIDEQQPMFTDIWNRVGTAVDQTNNAAFTGDWVAGPTAAQQSGVQQLLTQAPNLGAAGGSLSDMATKVASGYFLDPTHSPEFNAAASAAIRPVTDQLTQNVLPLITDASIKNSGAGSVGAYGGSRQDIQQNQALTNWERTAGDITSKMAQDTYNKGLDLIPKAGQIAADANTQLLAPAMTTGAAGTQQQAWDQGALENEIKKWQAGLQAPFYGLQEAANILNTGGFKNTNSTSVQSQAAPDLTSQWIQGITGGLGAATSLLGLPGIGSLGNIFTGMFSPNSAMGFASPTQRA